RGAVHRQGRGHRRDARPLRQRDGRRDPRLAGRGRPQGRGVTAPHSRELAVAREAAAAASELLLGYFDMGVEAEAKGDRDLVSVADRDAEAVVRRVTAETFPDDLVVGEEGAEVSAAAA